LPNIPYINNTTEQKENLDKQIIFVGNIEYIPNYSGLEHFLNNIFPKIIKEIPDIRFNIIGAISAERKSEWLSKYNNISIKGFINDL
jgi:hypothetical protein